MKLFRAYYSDTHSVELVDFLMRTPQIQRNAVIFEKTRRVAYSFFVVDISELSITALLKSASARPYKSCLVLRRLISTLSNKKFNKFSNSQPIRFVESGVICRTFMSAVFPISVVPSAGLMRFVPGGDIGLRRWLLLALFKQDIAIKTDKSPGQVFILSILLIEFSFGRNLVLLITADFITD